MNEIQPQTRQLFRRLLSGLKPPPVLTVSQWADRYRRLSFEASALPGRWRTDKAPYQRPIMDAISDKKYKKIIIMSAAQMGKTDAFILNPIGYNMHYSPTSMLAMQPTIQMAESFSKERLSPMLRDTPALQGLVNEKSRFSGNTILQKRFPGGFITMIGANSPSALASRPVAKLFADEIDRYPPTAGKEGDPLLLAEKRQTTFWNRKTVCTSTPTIKGLSRIEAEFERSTRDRWQVPCPACGERQELLWQHIIFDPQTGVVRGAKCDKCGAVSTEGEWRRRFGEGVFVPEDPEAEVKGFFLNSLVSPFTSWGEITAKFLSATEQARKGNVEELKVWTNTEMGQSWEEDGTSLDDDALYARRERYNCEVPQEVVAITCGVDTQDNRFEYEIVGWGRGKESWGIEYGVIFGDMKKAEIWQKLDENLARRFTREDGVQLPILCACIDSGGHQSTGVYRFCKDRIMRNIFAIRGVSGMDKEYVTRPSLNNRQRTPLFNIAVDVGKTLLYQRLSVKDEGENYCHFPREKERGYDRDYFKGLTAETMVMTYKKGHAMFAWRVKSDHIRNEPLDCRNYAQAALEIVNPPLSPEEVQRKPKGGRRQIQTGNY